MCYGPELESIFETIRRQPGQDITMLKQNYQYVKEGDITSLIDSALTMLEDLEFVRREGTRYFTLEDRSWSNKEVFLKLQRISQLNDESLNYVFASLYEQIFVKPDRMFATNIHYQINSKFTKTMVGHEKINAWKRMMECWGLGRRVYSGFYALPHLTLLQEIISEIGEWEGGLHPFCDKNIKPILPCVTSEGNIFRGTIYGLMALHDQNVLEISYKQDLPYKSYGPNNEWNWIKIGKKESLHDTLSE
jgi:hypothetical protein